MAPILSQKYSAKKIREELNLLRSFIIGMIGKDKEGAYRPEFVKRVFRSLQERANRSFRDEKSFLQDLRKAS